MKSTSDIRCRGLEVPRLPGAADWPLVTRSTTPPDRVPTLTEVLDPDLTPAPMPGKHSTGSDVERATRHTPAAHPSPAAIASDRSEGDAEQASAEAVVRDLQTHIDRVLEARLRGALEPILQQTIATVLEETRRELASTLREGMSAALARQAARHRNQP